MKGDGATLPISLRETLELEWWNSEFIGWEFWEQLKGSNLMPQFPMWDGVVVL